MSKITLAELQAALTKFASENNGDGASMISIEDSAGNFTGTTVEAALDEISTATPSTSGGFLLAGRVNGDTLSPIITSSTIGATYSVAEPITGAYDITFTGVPAGNYHIDFVAPLIYF